MDASDYTQFDKNSAILISTDASSTTTVAVADIEEVRYQRPR